MKIQPGAIVKRLIISACLIMIANSCHPKMHPKLQPSLKNAFKNSFYIGSALNQDEIMTRDNKLMRLLKEQFNSITSESLFKWDPIHPQPDKYNFTPADSFVAFGERNGMFIVGHTLIWYYNTPDWVFKDGSGNPVDRETLLQRMHDHIFAVVGRYKGRINGWDVVNEAVESDGQLRQSKWMEIIGEEYIQKAFEWAHEADPNAELYYNDNNMWQSDKRKAVLKLLSDLQKKGIPIHGVGMQGHWGLNYPSLKELEESITAYSGLGIKVMITELDLNILPNAGSLSGVDVATMNRDVQMELNPYVDELPDSMQEKLMDRYADLFKIFNKHRNEIERVTFWGVYDGVSWLNNWPIQGRTAYPLLFDRKLQPKPAFHAVIKTAD